MAGNLYFNRQAAQPSFYQEPLQYLEGALQQKQQRYDSYLALSDELSNMQIDSRDADRARANTILQGFQTDIDKAVEGAGGDYSNIGAQLHSIGRGINKSLSPGNAGYEIASRKVDFDKADAQKRELVARGVIPERQYAAWKGYEMNKYQGIGTKNVNTGLFNPMELSETSKAFEVSDLVDKFAKQIVPTNISSGKWKRGSDGTLWEYNKYGKQEVTPERVREVVMEGLQSHQGWQDYSSQMQLFGDPISSQEVNSAIDRAVNTFAFKNVQTDHNIRFTPQHLLKSKEPSGDNRVSGYRQSFRDDKGFTSKIDTDQALGLKGAGIAPGGGNVTRVVDRSIWADLLLPDSQTNFEDYKEATKLGKSNIINQGEKSGYVSNVIGNKDFKGDKVLLQTILDTYGKGSKANGFDEHSQEDAKQIMEIYNNVVENSSIYQPLAYQINNQDLRNTLNQTYLTNGGITEVNGVIDGDPSNSQTSFAGFLKEKGVIGRGVKGAQLEREMQQSLYMTDKEGDPIPGKLRVGYTINNLEAGINGRIPFGYQLDTPYGKFIFADNNDNNQAAFAGTSILGQVVHDPNRTISQSYYDSDLGLTIRAKKEYSVQSGTQLGYNSSREDLEDSSVTGRIVLEYLDKKGNPINTLPLLYEDVNGQIQQDPTQAMTLEQYQLFKNKKQMSRALPRANKKPQESKAYINE